MSRKNNKINKIERTLLSGGELAAIERMIIQNAKPKAQNRKKKRVNSQKSYKPSQTGNNAAISFASRQETRKPQISYLKNGNMFVKHKELVTPVSDNGIGFEQVGRFRVNPASRGTFRWLSGIAPSFETYRFRKLGFRYIPRCATTEQGSVLLVPDYDAADTQTLTEDRATQHVNAVEDVLWKEIFCVLRPESMNRALKSHFTCTDERFVQTSQDSKTLDAAQFFLFIDSNTPGTDGKLWVEYEVDLTTPQPPEFPLSLGGAGTNKNAGLLAGSANIFTSNALIVNAEEPVPILEVLPSSSFPGPDLFKFTRDWSGFITKEAEGTGLTGTGTVLRNGTNAIGQPSFSDTITQTIEGSLLRAVRQIYGDWKEGDLLGSGPVTATTLTRMIHNLGGSSVF
jgi:hypothetical protein